VAQYDLNKSYLYKINRKKNGTTLVLFLNPQKKKTFDMYNNKDKGFET
jgi:hypothetical protein